MNRTRGRLWAILLMMGMPLLTAWAVRAAPAGAMPVPPVIDPSPPAETAKLVFVQKSSYKAFREASSHDPLFWPIRGKGASGNALVELLQSHQDTRNPSLTNAFQLSIGGYCGPSYSLELKGKEITYKAFGYGYELENSEIIIPTMEQLEQFLEKIKKIGVWKWKRRYTEPHVLDGTSWSVSIEYKRKRFKSSGSNAYPEGFDEFTKSVRKLINKPFQ